MLNILSVVTLFTETCASYKPRPKLTKCIVKSLKLDTWHAVFGLEPVFTGAPEEKNLAKYLKYHFLLSKIISELFKGIFV